MTQLTREQWKMLESIAYWRAELSAAMEDSDVKGATQAARNFGQIYWIARDHGIPIVAVETAVLFGENWRNWKRDDLKTWLYNGGYVIE